MAAFTPVNAARRSSGVATRQEGQHEPATQQSSTQDSAVSSARSFTNSVPNSQETVATVSTDQIVTPPPSDTSAGLELPGQPDRVRRGSDDRQPKARLPVKADGAFSVGDHSSQLLHFSTIAAAQDRMMPDGTTVGAKKRMADGFLKTRDGSRSPVKGHSRNTSAVSTASTAASHMGEVSSELRTLLSYAMVKVNKGWQSRSLEEVESLASQATSPTSSVGTISRRQGSSASPLQSAAPAPASARVHFSKDSLLTRRNSTSPRLQHPPEKPELSAPAPIRPSLTLPQSALHPRRTSNPRQIPAMLSRQTSGSPRTPRTDGTPLPISRTEQDVAESLLFMSSPGNSANVKHAFSPSVSPGAQLSDSTTRQRGTRHALPSGPRKALPTQRPSATSGKKPGGMLPPGSPMDLDSLQGVSQSPNRGTPKRRVNGGPTYPRPSFSLPNGLGAVPGGPRKSLCDDDIEKMLDRAGVDPLDSSDDEEIHIPTSRRSTASVTGH